MTWDEMVSEMHRVEEIEDMAPGAFQHCSREMYRLLKDLEVLGNPIAQHWFNYRGSRIDAILAGYSQATISEVKSYIEQDI